MAAVYTDYTMLPNGHTVGFACTCVDYLTRKVDIETIRNSYFDASVGDYLPYREFITVDYTEPMGVLLSLIVDGEMIVSTMLPIDKFVTLPIISDLNEYIDYGETDGYDGHAYLNGLDEDVFDGKLLDRIIGSGEWVAFFDGIDDRYGLIVTAMKCDPYASDAKLLNSIASIGWTEILDYYST